MRVSRVAKVSGLRGITSTWQLRARINLSSQLWILFLMLVISVSPDSCSCAFSPQSKDELKRTIDKCLTPGSTDYNDANDASDEGRQVALEEYHCDLSFEKQTPGRRPEGANYFVNKDDMHIFWRCWLPKDGRPKGIVILCHGLSAHSGRYDAFATSLTQSGFGVYALDHQGHGLSEGERGYVHRFKDLVQDVLQFTDIVKGRHAPLAQKFFLVGHSMGGLIAVHTILANAHPWAGVVLSAPALKPDPKTSTPFIKAVARVLSYVFPKLPLRELPLEGLSSDPKVVEDYVNDPLLVRCGGVRARVGSELLGAMEQAMRDAPSFKLPFLILHGRNDSLVLPEGSEEFYELAGTRKEDKKDRYYEGLRHNIFEELDKTPVQDMLAWLEEQYSKS